MRNAEVVGQLDGNSDRRNVDINNNIMSFDRIDTNEANTLVGKKRSGN